MIKSFADERTRRFWETGTLAKWPPASIRNIVKRKLQMLEAVENLEALRIPPGNRMHLLTDDREGQHAIRVNAQFRICFRWRDGNAYEVEITDYH